MRLFPRLIAAALLTALAAPALAAQVLVSPAPVPDREGVYASVGVGLGSATTQLDGGGGLERYTQQTPSFALALGVTVTGHWRVGAEANYAWADNSVMVGGTGSSAFYTATVAYYPSLTGAFWIKGNAGFSTFKLSVTGTNPGGGILAASGTESGFAAGLGVGYDFRPGNGSFLIVPFATYLQQFPQERFSGLLSAFWTGRVNLLQAGVGIGYNH